VSSVKQVSRFSTGTWWWVRVLPPPGTLIWRFPGLIRPRRTAGATHRITGSHYGAELHTGAVYFARIDFKWLAWFSLRFGSDTGIRTRVSAVRGRRPRPLDDIANEINDLREGHETPTLACVSFVLLDGLGEKLQSSWLLPPGPSRPRCCSGRKLTVWSAPRMVIATFSVTPRLVMFRSAERLKSCGLSPTYFL
jgi:hypothetical protein